MEHTTATRTQVLAAYRADPTVTVRDLQARFGVGKSTIAAWLKEDGLNRQRGARKGAPMANRLVVEDDFKAVLLGWYGVGAAYQKQNDESAERAAWAYDGDTSSAVNLFLDRPHYASPVFVFSSPSAQALVDRAVGKSWRKIALDLLLEDHPTGSPDPALLRRAESDAVDLKRKVKRRLDALADDPTYQKAVEMFTTHWMSRRPAWMRSPRGRSQTGLDNRTK
jgi:hypothetical protein